MRSSGKSPGPHVLCYGTDPLLIETRKMVLEKGGFVTATVSSFHGFEACLGSRDFDLILLCHSLSDDEREEALQHVSPEKTLALIAAKPIRAGLWAVSTVNALDGPRALLHALQTKLDENRPQDAHQSQPDARVRVD